MSNHSSELVEISKLNGDFKRNYGKLIGALLYLQSNSAPVYHLHLLGRGYLCQRTYRPLVPRGARDGPPLGGLEERWSQLGAGKPGPLPASLMR